jgi:glucan 1,3-beta-glucosidase
MTRLASEHEDEDRRERSRDEDEARRERRRQRKKAALAGAGVAAGAAAGALGADIAEGRSRHKSGARVVSGAYLEEGRSPEMKMRRRGGGGPAMEDDWKHEDNWEGSYEDGDQQPKWKFWASWSKKKRLFVGSLVGVLLLLAIIIPVAVLEVNKNNGSDSSSSSSNSGSSTSNLDGISRDSIPVSLIKPYFNGSAN